MNDIIFIKLALQKAKIALKKNEVPVGALIVSSNGSIISSAYNTREKSQNAINHAELTAINKACKKLNSWRLDNCTLYITMEPCLMCLGAAINARIEKIVFGAYDSTDALENLKTERKNNTYSVKSLNHKILLTGGVCEEECSLLLKEFFKKRR